MDYRGKVPITGLLAALAGCLAVLCALVLWPAAGAAGGADGYSVSVSRSGDGHGTVVSKPTGINCGSVCDASFSLGSSLQLTAQPARGSRFAGWSGACDGTGACAVSTPGDGLPVSVGAVFSKAAPPTAKWIGKPTPKLTRVRVGCGDPVSCDLRVTVLLSYWLSKKGYDYYKAKSDRVRLNEGVIVRDVALHTRAVGKRLVRAIRAAPGRKAMVKVVVKDVDTGTQMAINQNCFCGHHPCGTNIKDKTK